MRRTHGIALLLAGVASAGVSGIAWSQVTTRPSTRPATSSSRPTTQVLAPVKEYPPLPTDAIERPAYMAKPHPIAKSVTNINALVVRASADGTYMGKIAPLMATVPPETRRAGPGTAAIVTSQAAVGAEMKTAFAEAVTTVKMRYPLWEPGRIDISFDDKYTPHDGGSAGTAFAVLLLSELEGFDIDSKCAITGDISRNWKVQKIGGVAAKIRGATADQCKYVCIPLDNEKSIDDLALMYGDATLRDIQIFSIATLQEAVGMVRTDRHPQITESMKLFDSLTPNIKTLAALKRPENMRTLEQVLAMTPNHLSAKHLLSRAKGTAPTKLSVYASLAEMGPAVYEVEECLFGGELPTRATLSQGSVAAAYKVLDNLRKVAPPEVLPLITDLSAFISTADGVAAGRLKPTELIGKQEAFFNRLKTLTADKDLMAKMMREGGF